MRLDLLSRILFIIYCVEAGTVLLLVPWGAGWERTVIQISLVELRGFLLHPLFRSSVSGFGILHLIWAAHDLDLLLSLWRSRERSSS